MVQSAALIVTLSQAAPSEFPLFGIKIIIMAYYLELGMAKNL